MLTSCITDCCDELELSIDIEAWDARVRKSRITPAAQSGGGGDITLGIVFVPTIANSDGSLETW
jgi:hypothetical protein